MKKYIKTILVIIITLLLFYCIYYKNYKSFESLSSTEDSLIFEESEESKNSPEIETFKDEHVAEKIIVHITGAIQNAGVIELEKGSRIIDAVNEAGGFTETADTEKINLAYELKDGVKIYIPNINDEESANSKEYITDSSGSLPTIEENKTEKILLININKASQSELESLPGIGPSIALKIILYRQENGNFLQIEDIKNVQGIGESKFENIKQFICIW